MTMRVLAIDPGMSTGVAAYMSNGAIWTTTVPAHDGDMSGIITLLMDQRPGIIVIESFLTRGLISKYGLETIKLIGAVECMWHISHIASHLFRFELVPRTPSQRIVRVPEATRYMQERRADTGLKYTDHEVAALAHLFGWMRQEGIPYGHTSNTSALPATSV